MRFVYIQYDAAEELIERVIFQSVEFDAGQRLAEILSGKRDFEQVSPNITLVNHAGGLYILHRDGRIGKFVVIDLQTAPLFDNRPLSESLLIFQRSLRFCIRYWNNFPTSKFERHIASKRNSELCLIVILIQTAPNQERP